MFLSTNNFNSFRFFYLHKNKSSDHCINTILFYYYDHVAIGVAYLRILNDLETFNVLTKFYLLYRSSIKIVKKSRRSLAKSSLYWPIFLQHFNICHALYMPVTL